MFTDYKTIAINHFLHVEKKPTTTHLTKSFGYFKRHFNYNVLVDLVKGLNTPIFIFKTFHLITTRRLSR